MNDNATIAKELTELTAYIEQELIELQGKPRQPGWIDIREYAKGKGINLKAAAHVLQMLEEAGKLVSEMVFDAEKHQQLRVYRKV